MGEILNTWKLNNHTLKHHWVKEEIKKEIRKYLKTNENENIPNQNLGDVAKAVLRGKFIAINTYF